MAQPRWCPADSKQSCSTKNACAYARCPPQLKSLEHLLKRIAQWLQVYPDLRNIRDISALVAVDVIKAAAEDEMVANRELKARLPRGNAAVLRWVKRQMYWPEYRSLVFMPVGVNE